MGFRNLERNLLNLRGTTFFLPFPPSCPLHHTPHQPMLSVVLLFFSITFASNLALGCEGECIVNVTRFILRSYSTPVYNVFRGVVSHHPHSLLSLSNITEQSGEIENSMIPSSSRAADTLDYITPLLSSYEGNGYSLLENAIFPSYFHGKCEDPTTGITPTGCPNPSCPVVCGTPGSMVYHFPKLRRIAFDTMHAMLLEHTREGSDTYNAVLKTVKRFTGTPTAAASNLTARSVPRIFWARRDLDLLLPEYESMHSAKRVDDVGSTLKSILESIPMRLADACGTVGPDANGSADELQECSWEAETLAYISQFP